MKFTAATAALIIAFAADAAMGARLTPMRRARAASNIAKRSALRQSQPNKIKAPVNGTTLNVEYSENWAGAVIVSSDITSVTASVTVPSVSGSSDDCASAWVGIDGDTCETAILQTGIDFCGGDEYDAWYEWYPDYAYDFDLTVSAGDVIKMTVTATSDTAGTATLENTTTGKSVTETFSNVDDGSLCRTNAEWIVEDFEECDGDDCEFVPFADFGTVTFTGAEATIDGSTVEAGSYTDIFDIEQSKVLTSCSASGTTVTCKYE